MHLLTEFSEETVMSVEATFNAILKSIREHVLGGSVIYAKLRESHDLNGWQLPTLPK